MYHLNDVHYMYGYDAITFEINNAVFENIKKCRSGHDVTYFDRRANVRKLSFSRGITFCVVIFCNKEVVIFRVSCYILRCIKCVLSCLTGVTIVHAVLYCV